jgi:hypothetical protein
MTDSWIKKRVELESTIEILQETNKSLCIEYNIYKDKCIKISKEHVDNIEKYNNIKQRNVELKTLYDIKSRMNKNIGIEISELSSLIKTKNESIEKAKIEVSEIKQVSRLARESNKILQNKLKDKDVYIEKLIREIGCYLIRI